MRRKQQDEVRDLVRALFVGGPRTPFADVIGEVEETLGGRISVRIVPAPHWPAHLGVPDAHARTISGITIPWPEGWRVSICEGDREIEDVALAHELGHIVYGDVPHGEDLPAGAGSRGLHVALRSRNTRNATPAEVDIEQRAERFAAVLKAYLDQVDPAVHEPRHMIIDEFFDLGPR